LKPLNIFYQEPEHDRWFKYDRYPRKLLRHIIRGEEKPGSIMMVALGLIAGLERLGVPYRFNDFKYIKKNTAEIACIIGKPHLLDKYDWKNPIVFGPGIFSHPVDYPDLLNKYPNIKKILVPGPWMQKMFASVYGEESVLSWPVGIDTNKWSPKNTVKENDFLIYSKFLWNKEINRSEMLRPILDKLDQNGLKYEVITYGKYTHESLKDSLDRSKAVIFLCEHETQGMAYQQILSTDLPILAWDREDYWIDPIYYPEKVRFTPSSSVPYWDERCGLKFKGLNDFDQKLSMFLKTNNRYSPRQYILENLTLEICAEHYINLINSLNEDTSNS
jgi:hypothetical protein